MGEAKRRKLAGTYPDTSKPKVKEYFLRYPGTWITDEYGYEPVGVALASSVLFGGVGQHYGDCVFRHYYAWRLCWTLA